MSGSVENIDFIVLVVEAHNGSRNRNASLLFYLHPVGGRCFLYFVAFDCPCHMDGASEKQKFLGKCGLAGVRMGYYGECAPSRYFFVQFFRHISIVIDVVAAC